MIKKYSWKNCPRTFLFRPCRVQLVNCKDFTDPDYSKLTSKNFTLSKSVTLFRASVVQKKTHTNNFTEQYSSCKIPISGPLIPWSFGNNVTGTLSIYPWKFDLCTRITGFIRLSYRQIYCRCFYNNTRLGKGPTLPKWSSRTKSLESLGGISRRTTNHEVLFSDINSSDRFEQIVNVGYQFIRRIPPV